MSVTAIRPDIGRHRSTPLWLLQLLLLGLALATAWGRPSVAQGNAAAEVGALEQEVQAVERALGAEGLQAARLKELDGQLAELSTRLAEASASTEQQYSKTDADLHSLGEPTRTDPPELQDKRAALTEQKAELERQRGTLRVLTLRAEELQAQASDELKRQLAARLLARGPDLFALLRENAASVGHWARQTQRYLTSSHGIARFVEVWYVPVLVAAVVLLIGAELRARILRWCGGRGAEPRFAARFVAALVVTGARYTPYLLLGVAAAVGMHHLTAGVTPVPFLSLAAYGLPVFVLVVAIIELFLMPRQPAAPFLDVPQPVARQLARRLRVLALLVYGSYLLMSTLVEQRLPRPAFLLARETLAVLVILNLMWVVTLTTRLPALRGLRRLRVPVLVVLLAVLGFELLGYRNLSASVFRVLLSSLGVFALATLGSLLLRDLFDGLDVGRSVWHRRLKKWVGLKPAQHVPGLAWIRFVALLVLWSGFVLVVLHMLGLSETTLRQAYGYLADGFDVGSLHVAPARILFALFAFVLVFAATGWVRGRMESRWLAHTRMERGAREAMVTITGYVGVAVGVLVALGIAGVTFTNLAIIAGALSVGIGFGLQNIVNNFVSGLILLFERPVKTGDWIVVGNTEGFVKRIRIRSTQIETFDKADVIVPNSDLISNQVTNWMLYNQYGRITVPIGVAYGSDTAQVRNVLLAVAQAHDEVIKDDEDLQVVVLFMGFGESALNFELRCHIRRIDRKPKVVSDLNFAIDAAFRENNIQIPFPQRDLHLRTVPHGHSVNIGGSDMP